MFLTAAHSSTPPTPSPPSPSYPPSSLFLPGQRKAGSKRGECSRRGEARGASRAGSGAAVPASSTVEVAISPATTLHKSPTPPRFRWGGGVWGQHRHSLTPLPGGRAGRDAHGKAGRGLQGKESPGSAAAALFSLSRLTAKFPQPLACLAMSCAALGSAVCDLASTSVPSPLPPCKFRSSLALSPIIPSLPTDQLCVCALQVEGRGGGQHRCFPTPLPCGRAGVQVPPQVQPLGLQFVTWPPPVAPPLSRLANAIPSLALSPIIPSLPTDQSACVPCRWRGGAGVNTDASPHSSLVAVQGGRLEGALLHLPRVGRDSPAAAAPAKCSPSRLQLPPPPTAAPDKAALCSPLVNAFSLSHMHSHMHAHIISPSMLHPNQATCSSLAHIVQTPYSRYPPPLPAPR
ncbi:unnamed protein product [Closterium sp. NIES-64]|nr:unnamed protein product [Closterium sp. NIES-64]